MTSEGSVFLLFAVTDLWSFLAAAVVIALATATVAAAYSLRRKPVAEERQPESVNYHFTRQCNYECGFCFHTAKTSFVLPLEDAKRGLKMLKEAGKNKLSHSYI